MKILSPNQLNQHIYSVTELNRLARTTLEKRIGQLWICGEVSNLSQPHSGHGYFSLKDSQAQIRCAIFRSAIQKLKFKLENGQHVIAFAEVSLYEPRGDFQLIVHHMELTGDGALQIAFEQLKKRLAAAGLFDPNQKQIIPRFPKIIGVITSPTGAAIRDILSVLKRRFAAIPVIIYPTSVQGKEAAAQIVKAIYLANLRKECDILILARGGGSLEDLWPFNEEIVARAIFASHLPVVTGIGHEIDFTIADFVADLRAPTPSAAAERVSPDSREWLLRMNQLQQRLSHLLVSRFHHYQTQLLHISKRLRHPGQRLQDQAQYLDQLERRLVLAQKSMIQQNIAALKQAAQALNVLSPLQTLERGYAIVRNKEKTIIITDSNQLVMDQTISVQLARGQCDCVVINLEN